MIERNPIGNDAREAARLRRLGPGPYLCLFCGLGEPQLLIRKTLGWLEKRLPQRFLEAHHVLCQNHDPLFTVLLCPNCHAKVTKGYMRAGIEDRSENDPVICVSNMLDARAAFSEQDAEALRRCANLLRKARSQSNEPTQDD